MSDENMCQYVVLRLASPVRVDRKQPTTFRSTRDGQEVSVDGRRTWTRVEAATRVIGGSLADLLDEAEREQP